MHVHIIVGQSKILPEKKMFCHRFLYAKCGCTTDIDTEIVFVYGNIVIHQNVTKYCRAFLKIRSMFMKTPNQANYSLFLHSAITIYFFTWRNNLLGKNSKAMMKWKSRFKCGCDNILAVSFYYCIKQKCVPRRNKCIYNDGNYHEKIKYILLSNLQWTFCKLKIFWMIIRYYIFTFGKRKPSYVFHKLIRFK